MWGGTGALFSDSVGSIGIGSGWNHVAMTYDGSTGTQTLYINGTAYVKTGAPATMNAGDGNATMGIGAKLVVNGTTPVAAIDSPGYFNGKLDDLTMWDETLTSDQIAAIYADGLNGTAVPEPGSLALCGLGGLCLLRRRRGV